MTDHAELPVDLSQVPAETKKERAEWQREDRKDFQEMLEGVPEADRHTPEEIAQRLASPRIPSSGQKLIDSNIAASSIAAEDPNAGALLNFARGIEADAFWERRPPTSQKNRRRK